MRGSEINIFDIGYISSEPVEVSNFFNSAQQLFSEIEN